MNQDLIQKYAEQRAIGDTSQKGCGATHCTEHNGAMYSNECGKSDRLGVYYCDACKIKIIEIMKAKFPVASGVESIVKKYFDRQRCPGTKYSCTFENSAVLEMISEIIAGVDMHDLLIALTANLPMRTIEISGEPYLERYHVKTEYDGTQHWLHRFLRNDSERHQHSHPWEAHSKILCGSYLEDRNGTHASYETGDVNTILPETMHRIIEVVPNTWTYMRVSPGREPYWVFIDDSGARTPMVTSPVDWWKDCKPRGCANGS